MEIRDVRKKGFSQRTPVAEVIDWLDREVRPLGSETIPTQDAHQRVLSETVISSMAVPSFDRAMMDGYALVAESFQGASPNNPLPMEVVGTSLPGCPTEAIVESSKVVQIMTGAPMPQGANAVLPFELVDSQNENLFAIDSVPAQKNVGYVGEDINIEDEIAGRFQWLRPQDVGLLTSVGVENVSVFRRPQVNIVVSGNEIVPVGSSRKQNQVFDSNGPMLRGLIERDGGTSELLFCEDDPDAIRQTITRPADVVLVSGGTSVGAEDFAPGIVRELGELVFHGIAMRPSSPTGLGKIGSEKFVFLLPGNPVSCMCAYDFFAGRAIRILGGRRSDFPYQKMALPMARKISSVLGRLDYCRIKIKDGNIEPIAIRGASVLSSLANADGFLLIEPHSEGFDAGEVVDAYLFEQRTGAQDG